MGNKIEMCGNMESQKPVSQSELKRCPFCGGKAHVKKDYVECTTCGVFMVQTSFGKGDGIHQVINRWNARHYPPEVQQAVEISNAIQHCGKCGQAHILDGMNMDELIQHFKNLEEDETLKRIDDAYNRGWYDAMNNPEVNKALERLKPKNVLNIQEMERRMNIRDHNWQYQILREMKKLNMSFNVFYFVCLPLLMALLIIDILHFLKG